MQKSTQGFNSETYIQNEQNRSNLIDFRKSSFLSAISKLLSTSLAIIVMLFISNVIIIAKSQAQTSSKDQIRIVGSSTVFPFSSLVAELFSKKTKFKSPIVESTGTGGGFKLLCSKDGSNKISINNASRAIKQSEIDKCSENGISLTEVTIGYDGIVIARSRDSKAISLSLRNIFLALAEKIEKNGKLIDNPYKQWIDIDKSLPAIDISVYGPPPTSGTRDAFLELAMEAGAKKIDFFKKLSKSDFSKNVHSLRQDGAFIEAGENDNLIVQKLVKNKNSFGIFGFSFLEQNIDKVRGALVENANPTYENISNVSYPLSRKLYFYFVREDIGVVTGLKEFVNFFLEDNLIGEDGSLSDKGLVALPPKLLATVRSDVSALKIKK